MSHSTGYFAPVLEALLSNQHRDLLVLRTRPFPLLEQEDEGDSNEMRMVSDEEDDDDEALTTMMILCQY